MTVLVVEIRGSTESPDLACRALAGRIDVVRCSEVDVVALVGPTAPRHFDLVVVACDANTDDGHRACRTVRAATNTLLALLTPSRREADELLAFALGCDDYIPTSTSPEVLRARLEVLALRGGHRRSEHIAEYGPLHVDPAMRVATVYDVPLALTRIEFDLLHILVTSQRRVVSRSELLEVGWGGCPPSDHVLDVHLSRLRRKVLAAGGPKVAEPVPGVGYRVGSAEDPRAVTASRATAQSATSTGHGHLHLADPALHDAPRAAWA